MITLIVFCAKYLFLVAPLIALWYLLRTTKGERAQIVVLALVSFPLSYAAAKVASMLYENPRPFVVIHVAPLVAHAADNGFPSDHALILSAFAALFMFFNKKASVVLWLIAIIVSVARVFAGVHHPIDVVGSMLIALAATSLAYIGLRKLKYVDFTPH